MQYYLFHCLILYIYVKLIDKCTQNSSTTGLLVSLQNAFTPTILSFRTVLGPYFLNYPIFLVCGPQLAFVQHVLSLFFD